MATTKPVNQNAMPQAGIKAFIRNSFGGMRYEVGVIDDPAFELAGETKDVDYHNYSTKKVVDGDMQNFNFKMYELRPELLEIINKGLSQVVTYDGVTAVAWYTQVIKSGDWGYGPDGSVLLTLPNVGAVIALTSIVGWTDGDVSTGSVTKARWNDYSYVEFTMGAPFTTLAQDLTLVYTATPTEGFYEKPKSSGMPTGFIMEAEWNGVDDAGNAMQILKIFDNCQPEKPVVSFAGDKDDKGAFIDLKVKGRVIDVRYKGFATP